MAFDGRESVQLLGVSSSALFRSGSVPNRDCGRTVPFLGIFVSNFRCCVFAVKKNCEVKTMAKALSVWVCQLMISMVGVPLCKCDSGTGLLCVACVLGPSNSGSATLVIPTLKTRFFVRGKLLN